jgi:outer membrane protein
MYFNQKKIYRIILIVVILIKGADSTFALNLNEAVDKALETSNSIKLEKEKMNLASLGKLQAVTLFLPQSNITMHKFGTRSVSAPTMINTISEDTITANISQPLFSGLKGISKANELMYKSQVAEHDFAENRNNLILKITELYLDIVKLTQSGDFEIEAIKHYKEIIDILNRRLKIGNISFSDYVDYESKYHNLLILYNENQAILKEKKSEIEQIIKTKIGKTTYPIIEKFDMEIDEVTELVIERNPKIQSFDKKIKVAKSNLASEYGKLLPKIDLVAEYNQQKASLYFAGGGLTTKAVYVNISIPIFQSGSEYVGIVAAHKQKNISRIEKEIAKEEAVKNVNNYYYKLKSAKENISVLKEILTSTKRTVEIFDARFKAKDASKIDLLLKKIEMTDLQKKIISTKKDMLYNYYLLYASIDNIS